MPRSAAVSLSGKQRVALVLLALFLSAGFLLAWRLVPDPRGFGTHQRLGFPPCSLRLLYNIPCPLCGMTTSFSHFVRGEFGLSARANLAGVLLAIVSLLLIPWSLTSAVRGRVWFPAPPSQTLLTMAVAMAIVVAANWIGMLVSHGLTSRTPPSVSAISG